MTGRSAGVCSFFSIANLMLFSLPSFGQASKYEGRTIARIEYQPEVQPLASADMERVQALRVGDALRASGVASTIDGMFATGRYEDIQVDTTPDRDGVVVRFVTQPARFIGHVSVIGKISDPPNSPRIISAGRFDLGSPFHPEILDVAEKQIQQLFVANGLYEAKATLQTSDEAQTQGVNITIAVDARKRARYQAPEISGDAKLSDAIITRATGWRVRLIGRWRQVTESLTRRGVQGVQKKYQGEGRLTATVNLQDKSYDAASRRVTPKLEIQAGPKVQVKALEAKVSKRRLRRYVPIFQEGAVDQDLLVEGARNLKDYFQSEGYPDVDITFRQLPVQNDELTIQYFISQGARQKLAHVEIKGNEYFSKDTIRERMFLQPSSFRFRWGRYSDGFRLKDEETIATLYRQNGFRDVSVSSAVAPNYGGKPNRLGITIAIDEGFQWVVSQVALDGASEADRPALLSLISSSDGQPYSDVSIATDRASIVNFYRARGYLNAAVEASVAPASAPHQVLLTFRIEPGEQKFVRDIVFSGLKKTRLSYVKNNLRMDNQGPLSLTALRDAQRRLDDLGAFSNVQAAVQNPEGDEAYKYVLFDFQEGHRYSLSTGFGAEFARIGGTTTNLQAPAGSTGFSPRLSVDIKRMDQWGLNHTVDLQTILSTIEKRAALSYLWPQFWNSDRLSITFTALYDASRDVTTFSALREEGSVQVSQKLSKPSTVLVRFAYRRVSTNNIVIPALLVPQLLQPVRIGILSANFVQDRRDNAADAHHGIYNTLDTGVTSKIFGSQRSFLRVLGRNATYKTFGHDWVFARQTTFGTILPFATPAGLSSADAVPLPERFFGGGNVSHRGFPENQAGPRDIGSPAGSGGMASVPTGFPLGGNSILFNNLELRHPLWGDNISGVLFHDAGNVYQNFNSISFRFRQRDVQDFNYMVHAVGLGIRYKTPVGPVRFDLAYSINPPSFVGFKGTINDLLQCNPNLPQNRLPAACQGQKQGISHFQFFFSIGQTF